MRRLGRWIGVAVAVLSALAAGNLIVRSTPDTDELSRPFVTTGVVGEPVAGGPVTVTVLGVRGGTRVAVASANSGLDADVAETGGIFVLVKVQLLATGEAASVRHASIRDGAGRTFLASQRLLQHLGEGAYTLQPGIKVEGEIFFELPRDATDLTLRLATSAIVSTFYQEAVEVQLPVTAEQRTAWAREWRVQEIAYPAVVS